MIRTGLNATLSLKFAVLTMLAGMPMLSGCSFTGGPPDLLAPPDMSSFENAQRELRYAGYDQQQLIDDFDRFVTMSRPTGYMTPFNVRSSD